MNAQKSPTAELAPQQAAQRADHDRRRRAVVNWALALLTVPTAAVVVIFAVGATMSMAACSAAQCQAEGPSGLVYGVLLYGAPVVSVLTIIISIFTAFRRRGFLVPSIALAWLLADFAAIALLF